MSVRNHSHTQYQGGPAEAVRRWTPEDGPERREEERRYARGRTVYVLVDDALHAFHLRNISSRGVMGSTTIGLADAETIRLRFENGALVPAVVKWSQGALTGLAFPSPIPPDLLVALHPAAARTDPQANRHSWFIGLKEAAPD